MKSRLRTLAHVAVAALPGALKKPIYRHVFRFQIADDVQIGFSVLDVDHLELSRGARIGHGNLLTRTRLVRLGEHAEIGMLNILRGGERIDLAPHASVIRFNVLNSIPDNDADGEPTPTLEIGEGATVVSSHRLDFTDRIRIGKNVIIAGRNSSLWTHNRQATKPITIGDFCYLGSEVRLAPGAKMGDLSILGMGGVLAGEVPSRTVSGGVPARQIRPITEADEQTLRKKTKRSIPDDLY